MARRTLGFQAPRPSLVDSKRTLLQGIITLKHMAVNSLENTGAFCPLIFGWLFGAVFRLIRGLIWRTAPWTRHSVDANEALGVDPFVLSDYYLRPFKSAIKGGDARGVMCSYNAVLGKPTCLSPIIRTYSGEYVYIIMRHNLHLILGLNYAYIFPGVVYQPRHVFQNDDFWA